MGLTNAGKTDIGALVTRCPTGDAHEWDHPPQNVWTCQVCGLKHCIGKQDEGRAALPHTPAVGKHGTSEE